MSPRITKTIEIVVDFWLDPDGEIQWGKTPSKHLYEFSEFSDAATEAEEELANMDPEETEDSDPEN